MMPLIICIGIYVAGVAAVLLERALNFSDEPINFVLAGWPMTVILAICWPLLVVVATLALTLDFVFGWVRDE